MHESRISNLLKQAIGMDAEIVGQSVIDHAVRARMTVCALKDRGEYWERLRHSAEELQLLVEEVVVPETWFFRDAEAYVALADFVLNHWAPANLTGVLNVLSAPCSTGEEPYSIAMALLDAGLPAPRFKIEAVDVSERALADARRAVYGRNAFRGRALDFRERHFRPVAGGQQLNAAVRERVRFEQANLIGDSFLPGAAIYDVIFCRNVLIYLDGATQERVIKAMDRLLTPNGIFFVGPAEAFLTRAGGFQSANYPSAFACRKADGKMRAPIKPWQPPEKKVKPAAARPGRNTGILPVRPAGILPAETGSGELEARASHRQDAGVPDLESAGRLADTGRLAEAREACEAHLLEHGASAAAYYLLALVRDSLGDQRGAAESYRKVIYLDPDHPEALLHLALLAEKQGDPAAARRLLARVRRGEEAIKK